MTTRRANRTVRLSLIAAAVLILTALSGCGWFAEEPPLGLADAFVTFPDSISSGSSSRSISARSAQGIIARVQGLYTPVRDQYNRLAEDAIAYIADLMGSIDRNIFGNDELMAYLEENGSVVLEADDGSRRWQITKTGNDYTVAGWMDADGSWEQLIYVDFTALGDDISGTVWIADENQTSGNTLYRAAFDTNDENVGQLTELAAINLDDQNTDLAFNVPTALWLEAHNDGEAFQIAANIYYTDVNVESGEIEPYFMEVLNNEQDSDYTDGGVNVCYTYRGAFAADGDDRGQVELALVPANYDASDYFTAYSLGAVYEQAIGAYVTADAGLLTIINNSVVDPSPALTEDSTPAEVMAALEALYEQDPTNTELENIIFATRLSNPAYFEASADDSFVGTANLETPAWADSLPAFALEIAQDQTTLPLLEVSFPAAMPATPPDPTF